jgi:hypothetical protein
VIEECFFCGATNDLTDDYVPPKGLFPSPRPTNLVTVLSCKACNKSYDLDDEYLRAFLASRSTRNPTGETIWDKKVVESTFRRSPKLREELRKTVLTSELLTPAGLYLGTLLTIGWKGKRLKRGFEKIVRGLFVKEMGSRLPSEILFEFYDQSDFNMHNSLLVLYARAFERTIGTGDVFSYRFRVAQDDSSCGIWWLLFYRSTVVCGIHGNEKVFARFASK